MDMNLENEHDSAVKSIDKSDDYQEINENNQPEEHIDQRSTWGGRRTDLTVDPTTLGRYYNILRKLAITLIVLIILLISISCIMAGILIYNGDFEQIIFNDGTDALCILDPNTGAVKQYE
jgi:hypothetical protein